MFPISSFFWEKSGDLVILGLHFHLVLDITYVVTAAFIYIHTHTQKPMCHKLYHSVLFPMGHLLCFMHLCSRWPQWVFEL